MIHALSDDIDTFVLLVYLAYREEMECEVHMERCYMICSAFVCSSAATITNPLEGALTQLGSLCRLLRILDVYKRRHRFADYFAERLFKSSYNQMMNSHNSEASDIAKCGYSLTCPSM